MSTSASILTAAVDPATTPILTKTPWLMLGESKVTFMRAMKAGLRPPPVGLGTTRPAWKIADITAWVDSRQAVSPHSPTIG